jgi:hypothetical protein
MTEENKIRHCRNLSWKNVMKATVTLNTKLTADEKKKFVETAEALGLSSSSALKVLIRKFNEVGGFPFDVRRSPTINLGHPNLFRPKIEGAAVVLPASWRDDEDDN